jgi:hypothetical protein
MLPNLLSSFKNEHSKELRIKRLIVLLESVFKFPVANCGFIFKVFSIEVFTALLVDAFLSVVFSILEIVDKKNSDQALYSMLRVITHGIPLGYIVYYCPLFQQHIVLVLILILVYLFKSYVAIRNYLINLNFESECKSQFHDFNNYDKARIEKVKQHSSITSSSNYDLFIYCLWIIIPGLWVAILMAFTTILTGMFDARKKANINSIDNKKTFMTEYKLPINITIIGISFATVLIYGINFEVILTLSILFETVQMFAFRINKIPENIGILNVGKHGALNLFEHIGNTLVKRINTIQKNKSGHTYAVLKNFCALYNVDSEVLKYSEIRQKSRNFILVINNDGSDLIHRVENDLRYGLNNLMVVLDCYSIEEQGNSNIHLDDYSSIIDQNEYQFAKWRIELYSKLCDEQITLLKHDQIFSQINEDISTEAVLININVRNLFSEEEHNRLKELEGKGIFELNNLFRQAHETPSIPLRFIIYLMLWEASSQYFCGFLFAKQLNDQNTINLYEQEGWNKELSFGDFVNNLDKLLKLANSSPITNCIESLLQTKYTDKKSIELLSKLLRYYGWKDKINSEPNIRQLFTFMSFVRNKTRGHGIPSKVDFEFYLVLEKISIFLLSEIQKMNFGLYVQYEDQKLVNRKFILNLSSGGCPDIFLAVLEDELMEEYYPYFEKERFVLSQKELQPINEGFVNSNTKVLLSLYDNNELHLYSLDDFFKTESGILYAYHGIRKNHKSYISYTTGEHIRPTLTIER